MKDERTRRAATIAMRRRRGASKAHSEKVKDHMLLQEDLYTTCQTCGKVVRGDLNTVVNHTETCHGS